MKSRRGQPAPHVGSKINESGTAPGGPASLFRVKRWVVLPGYLDRLKYRKAMVAMSVGPVDRLWLRVEAGLRRDEVDAFLLALRREGALEVLPAGLPSPIPSFKPPPGVRPGFMPRLRHWLQGGGAPADR